MEHWQLPPLATLTKIARRTMSQLNPHIPMLHLPTFSLTQAPICVAFSICTIGGPKRGPQFGDNNDLLLDGISWEPRRQFGSVQGTKKTEDWDRESADVDSWDGLKSVVRREKTDMLVKVCVFRVHFVCSIGKD